jgi:hypothetical protein
MSAVFSPQADNFWVRFWHQPVRAERLALMRILLALALLGDQFCQFLPNLADFYGPDGVGPDGLFKSQLNTWKWTYAFFSTDNMAIIYPAFALWVSVTVLFMLGWRTRWTTFALWFLTRCFIDRNPDLRNKGDDVLQLAIFFMALSPCGAALSLDAWRLRRQGLVAGPVLVKPWSLRLIQLQLCLIYCSAGLVKLKGTQWGHGSFWEGEWFKGSWWDGRSMHYVMNLTERGHWSYCQLPLPFWITAPMSYLAVWWESLFPLLVLNRWTRRLALTLGVLFHLGISVVMEVGFFGFYTMSLYGVWIPDRFWSRFDKPATAEREPFPPGG